MANEEKDRTQKFATEMDQTEFVAWACGSILFGIGEGKTLQSIMWLIVNQAANNEVWGGAKKGKK